MGALTKDAEIMESLKKLRPTKKRKTKTQAGTPSKELPAQPGPGSLICSKCGSPYVVHNGQTTAGKDRVKCADCGKSWLTPPATSTTNSPPILSWSPGPLPFLPWMTPTQASAADDATNAQLNDLQAALSKLSKKVTFIPSSPLFTATDAQAHPPLTHPRPRTHAGPGEKTETGGRDSAPPSLIYRPLPNSLIYYSIQCLS